MRNAVKVFCTISTVTSMLCWSVVANAKDELCKKLHSFVADQKAETADPAPRHWVEFHWGINPDPNTFWSVGCLHSSDLSSKQFCGWLLDHTSREFSNFLPIRIQQCMGFSFPKNRKNEWHLTDGEIRHDIKDGWLVLEMTTRDLQPGESALRISYDTIDVKFEPDELPPIKPAMCGVEPN